MFFLSGKDTMSQLIREKNWNETGLGEPIHWSQHLKTACSVMLNSRFPMIIWWGKDLLFLYNEAYISTLGIKHPYVLGKPGREVWSEIWKDIGPLLNSVLQSGVATWSENQQLILERKGYPEETYHTFSYSPIFNEIGEVQGVFTAVKETTDDVLAERQLLALKNFSEAISDKKTTYELFNGVFDTIKQNPKDFPFAIMYKMENGKMKYVQATHEFPSVIAPDIVTTNEEFHWPLFATENTISNTPFELMDELPETVWQKPSSKVIILPFSLSLLNESIVIVIGLNPYRDINERYLNLFEQLADLMKVHLIKINEYELERGRAEALMEIDKAKTTFFTNISHEFRTPLTLILGQTEELINDKELQGLYEPLKNLETVHRNSMRLLKLVNTLLDFSRIEASRNSVHYTSVRLCSFTKELSNSFRSIVENAGIEFEVDCIDFEDTIAVDIEMWEKIVFNLLSNAFKYTQKGKITVQLKKEKEYATLNIIDTGIGIPKNELSNIFKRFYKSSASQGRSVEGTGIGLALVSELVKILHGTISVVSELGKGSCFTVKIPLLIDPSIKVEQHHHSKNGTAEMYVKEASGFISKDSEDIPQGTDTEITDRILVVDDNADMRNYLKNILQPYYHVDLAVNGKDALSKINNCHPELIVSDIMMPEINGVELLNMVKANDETAKIPVILLTARAGEESRIEGFEMGADDYLVKPFSTKELLARVKAQLRLAKYRQHINQQLKNLFIQAPIAIAIVKGPEFKFELVNERMLDLIQRTEKEVINKPAFEALPDAMGQGFEQYMSQAFYSGERVVLEEVPLTLIRNGKEVLQYLKVIYEPLHEEDGSISGLMALADIITEVVIARKKIESSEKRYRESEEELKKMSNAMPQLVWIANPIGYVTYFNNRASEFYNHVKENDNYYLWESIVHPDDTKVTVEFWDIAVANKVPYEVEHRLRLKDGSFKWHLSRAFPQLNEKGEIVKWFGTTTNIHDLKNSEVKLKDAESRLRLAIDSAHMGTWNYNLDKDQMECSERALELFGFSINEKITIPLIVNSIAKEDRQNVNRAITAALSDNKGNFNVEFAIANKLSGQKLFLKASGKVFFNKEQKARRFVGTVMDISDQRNFAAELEKRIEERTAELLQSNRQLQHTNEELEQFAFITSHDLQEPLRKIRIFTDLIQNNEVITASTQQYLQKINSSAARMSELIKAILSYSHLESRDDVFSTVDLNSILKEVLENLELMIKEKNAVIEVDRIPPIRGIATQLYQLIANLIENALKFSDGNAVITIKAEVINKAQINTEADNLLYTNYLKLTFKDNGIGFEQKFADLIFTIFQRLHDAHSYKGTGIGLALCKKIVENHQGFIIADSKPGDGAAFTVLLPIRDVEAN